MNSQQREEAQRSVREFCAALVRLSACFTVPTMPADQSALVGRRVLFKAPDAPAYPGAAKARFDSTALAKKVAGRRGIIRATYTDPDSEFAIVVELDPLEGEPGGELVDVGAPMFERLLTDADEEQDEPEPEAEPATLLGWAQEVQRLAQDWQDESEGATRRAADSDDDEIAAAERRNVLRYRGAASALRAFGKRLEDVVRGDERGPVLAPRKKARDRIRHLLRFPDKGSVETVDRQDILAELRRLGWAEPDAEPEPEEGTAK